MRVSIVIPAYNAERTLAECLAGCLAQSLPEYEVILVDDGSRDATAAIAQAHPIRYVHQANRGPASARNHGARVARGKFVAFLDADCVPRPDWIERLLEGFTTEDTVAVGGAYGIANPHNGLARFIHEEIRLRHEGFSETVDFLGSFNVAYRKEAFEASGGFDENFRIASAEDNDLAYRLADNGGVLRFTGRAIVEHYHPERWTPYLRTQMRHGFWRVKLYAKHPRRASGDHYASALELLRPPMVVAAAPLTGAALWCAVNPGSLALMGLFLWSLLLFFIGVSRTEYRHRILARMSERPQKRMGYLIALRDFARGLGFVRGVWTFLILRKETV